MASQVFLFLHEHHLLLLRFDSRLKAIKSLDEGTARIVAKEPLQKVYIMYTTQQASKLNWGTHHDSEACLAEGQPRLNAFPRGLHVFEARGDSRAHQTSTLKQTDTVGAKLWEIQCAARNTASL